MSNQPPKVSVIIPNYNRAHLISDTIDNLLKQTLKSKEIIVVDDGSTDESLSVLERYGSTIKVIRQKNKGPGAARNAGLRVAKGQYIQFFDSDDLMTLDKLEIQNDILDRNPTADLAYGPYVMAQEIEGGWLQKDVIMQYQPLPNQLLTNLVMEGWCAITQSCLFRKSAIDRVESWREDLMPHEDKEYWYRLATVIRDRIHENKTGVLYRQHQAQITDGMTKVIARTEDGIRALSLIKKQARDSNPSFHAQVMLEGNIAGYRKFLNTYQQPQKSTIREQLAYQYYRLFQKLGRVQTKSSWQPMHGISKDPSHFEEIVKKVMQ